ncbi:DUF4190 domain-containing protein [Patescibacteria group bacterium]|nr:MAG: DUF4190 domain-containing protein [Patescibacteria group bacterium]
MADQNITTTKTNTLAIAGLITAFFLPLVGLICSIIGLTQINKRKERGRGLAISGIVVSILVGIAQLITLVIVVAAMNSGVTLTTYRDNTIGYSVKYPEGWNIAPQNVEGVQGIIIKKEYKQTGKSYGQIEVGYFAPPANGYSQDILQATADGIKKSNKNTTVLYENKSSANGLSTLTLLTTYDGETGKIKAKTTIMLKKDNALFVISTQAPEENWDKYSDSFDEIHNTFTPN